MKFIKIADNLYERNVLVDVSLNHDGNFDYEIKHKTKVRFSIDIEARSWGIKDISVNISTIDPFYVMLFDPENRTDLKEVLVEIDPFQIEVNLTKGQGWIGVSDIDLYGTVVGDKVEINYEMSDINVYGL